jgi:hypothetical protein
MISPTNLAKLIEAQWTREAEQAAKVTRLDDRRSTDAVVSKAA